jgi:hypothetical protein
VQGVLVRGVKGEGERRSEINVGKVKLISRLIQDDSG